MDATLTRLAEACSEVRDRACEVEARRGLPSDLMATLRRAGCHRMLVPARHGGDALPLSEALRVVEALARADGSTGWTVGQVALAQLVFRCFPEDALAEVYADGPDMVCGGAVAPKGRAAPEGGGWRVSGQWPFVTGCEHASWLYLNCVVTEGRRLRILPGGIPETRMVLVPASEIEVLDTWCVMGLRGTGSHDVRVMPTRCPDRRTFALAGDGPGPAVAASTLAQAGLIIGACVVGMAQGALDDLVELAVGGKRQAFSAQRLGSSHMFRDGLGEAHASLRAARALIHAEAGAAAERTAAGAAASVLERAELRASASRVVALAVSAADAAYGLAGGSAVYERSPLQRRMRDVHTATQHFVARRDSYGAVGALLAGEEVETGGL